MQTQTPSTPNSLVQPLIMFEVRADERKRNAKGITAKITAREVFAAPAKAWRFAGMMFREARVPVQFIFAIRFVTAVALAAGLAGVTWRSALTCVAWVLATVAVYVFNGIMDIAEDRVNGSSRPIATGALPVPVAVAGVTGAALAALLLCLATGDLTLVGLLALYLGFGYAYSGRPFNGKRRGSTASFIVLALGALTYLAGWESSAHSRPVPVLLLASAMSLWMAGVGAFSKDLSDVAGDRAAGRRTPVIVWGETRTRVMVAVNAVAIGALYLLAARAWAPELVPSAATVLAGALAVAVLVRTSRRSPTQRGRRLPYRAFMVTQYAGHLVLLLWLAAR